MVLEACQTLDASIVGVLAVGWSARAPDAPIIVNDNSFEYYA